MHSIQEAAKGFEGKPEIYMAYSLQVQIESEIARLSVELSKLKILESISKELWEIKYTLKGERIR